MTAMPPAPVITEFPTANDFSPLHAISYAWNKFTQNIWTWVLAFLIALLLMLTVVGIVVATPFLTRGALLELDGKKPRLREFWRGINWGPAILTQLLQIALILAPVAVAFALAAGALSIAENVWTGTLVFAVFGLAVVACVLLTFFTYYAMFFVIDRKAGAFGSLTASAGVIRRNVGPLLVLALLNEVIISVGMSAVYLGLFVAYPIYIIASAYSYRFVTGGAISPDRPLPPPPPMPMYPGVPGPGYAPEQTRVMQVFPPPPASS